MRLRLGSAELLYRQIVNANDTYAVFHQPARPVRVNIHEILMERRQRPERRIASLEQQAFGASRYVCPVEEVTGDRHIGSQRIDDDARPYEGIERQLVNSRAAGDEMAGWI